jgi:hypothetical protein
MMIDIALPDPEKTDLCHESDHLRNICCEDYVFLLFIIHINLAFLHYKYYLLAGHRSSYINIRC